MWRLLLVLFFVVLGFLILRKKMKKPNYDKTDELIDHKDVEDLDGRDILDQLCAKMSKR
ncbi:hypothetical protein BST79_gp067 [Only Syngen Nebraska virus 5]|uniref:hypothetical protein n=1 Tax=Only Syngen Nebraska virus 5 TaxID=1917232 RepID=UPI00090115FB|nr:hypothetical protein BST79_gp067 [Only Syngen Nebraska virus 5]APC25580.1 hypothetical protein [Only Syngen Nebraska virus 5]